MVTRLLSPWDFPGKITGVGCRLFLQGIFLTEGSNPCLLHFLHWEAGYLQLRHLGSPKSRIGDVQNEKTFYGMQEISDFPWSGRGTSRGSPPHTQVFFVEKNFLEFGIYILTDCGKKINPSRNYWLTLHYMWRHCEEKIKDNMTEWSCSYFPIIIMVQWKLHYMTSTSLKWVFDTHPFYLFFLISISSMPLSVQCPNTEYIVNYWIWEYNSPSLNMSAIY